MSPRGPAAGMGLIAGYIELIGGALVMLGLFTTIAAFVCSGTMAVAYFMAHAGQGLWPIVNRGELAALYAFVFLYIAAHGSGRWSLDAMIFNRGRRTDTMPITSDEEAYAPSCALLCWPAASPVKRRPRIGRSRASRTRRAMASGWNTNPASAP